MSRGRRRVTAYGVFSPRGTLLTSRDNRSDAEFAAQILVGTDWKTQGYAVDPITVTRERTQHPDLVE